VFGKFFRAQNAQKKQVPGSGLGLFLTQKIIEGHGGHISFESEEDKGTTFFIELPIVE
jgi:signal transduction histidine kinase